MSIYGCVQSKSVMQRMLLHSQEKLRNVRRDLWEEKKLPTSQLTGMQDNLVLSCCVLDYEAGWP